MATAGLSFAVSALVDGGVKFKQSPWRSCAWCWCRTVQFWRGHWCAGLVALTVALLAIVFLVHPWDEAILRAVDAGRSSSRLAVWLSEYGEFQYSTLLLCLVLWLYGAWRKRAYLKRVAFAVLWVTLFASVLLHGLKLTLGRPRPKHRWDAVSQRYDRMPDGLYGPPLDGRQKTYNSFPSGHTTSTMVGAIPLALAVPAVGVPALVASGAVAWSRVRENQHYPSDVLGGVILGLAFGLPMGVRLRRVRRSGGRKIGK